MNDRPRLPLSEILLSITITAVLLAASGGMALSLYDATQFGWGVLFAVFNQVFYTFVTWMIFVKKNVAWVVLVIVIKYAILLVAIYLVWLYGEALMFAVGMLAELILTALMWLMLKKVFFKGTGTTNGPL
jgi:hypothetical protein